mmetsp:Transcript_24779/g.50713  ORF Transcript_24779/g.50713 Transcript_24779/m.50713 type:complete len:180 (-) Transcript_24779:586-1125(-)
MASPRAAPAQQEQEPSIDKERIELLALNQELLDSIANPDYDTYNRLCADDMSCVEPESNHNVVIGKKFHKYYFDLAASSGSSSSSNNKNNDDDGNHRATTTPPPHTNVTMVQPHVQWIRGGAATGGGPTGAVLSYTKLTQTQTGPGSPPVTMQQSETRVWEKREGSWCNIHFHKSAYAS